MEGNNIEKFLHEWDIHLMHSKFKLTEAVQEHLFKTQIKKHPSFHLMVELYEMAVRNRTLSRSYDYLREQVDEEIEKQKLDQNVAKLTQHVRGKAFSVLKPEKESTKPPKAQVEKPKKKATAKKTTAKKAPAKKTAVKK